jgi:GNAT superfamily N-acetyltransferase
MAVAAGSVVGFVILGPVRDSDLDPSTVHELYSMCVERDRVGTGLGRLLMEDALEYLRRGPWTGAVLWSFEMLSGHDGFTRRRDGRQTVRTGPRRFQTAIPLPKSATGSMSDPATQGPNNGGGHAVLSPRNLCAWLLPSRLALSRS